MKNKCPQKGARKIVIEDGTWWWLLGHTHIIIWNPSGQKTKHYRCDIVPYNANSIRPYDVRSFIDREIRKLSEEQIKELKSLRQAKQASLRDAFMKNMRKEVLVHAKLLVKQNNNLNISDADREKNKIFLEKLIRILVDDLLDQDEICY